MKKLFLFVILLIVVGTAVALFLSFYRGASSTLPQTAETATPELIKKGAYLARAGNCVACHTAPQGHLFAGGLSIESPIGAIYSTNITPDKATGIGSYSLQDFDLAMRHGVRADGTTLYPAMPYPSYARLHDDDIKALYAFFLGGGVEAVASATKKTDIPWPLSMRWPLTGWRLMHPPAVTAFVAEPGQDTIVARGAYLAQGLAHCGSCHTPRGLTLNEKAYSAAGPGGAFYLSGGPDPLDGWIAGNLRGDQKDGLGRVSEEDLAQLLKTGRNKHSALFGIMADVVNNSLQHLTDDDILAIARYLKTLPPVNPANPPFVYDASTSIALKQGDVSRPGAQAYLDSCAGCHRSDGQGYSEIFPALAGNSTIHAKNPTSLINIVDQGFRLEGTAGAPTSYSMPPVGSRYNDKEMAELITFIRSSWGNQAEPVSADDVRNVRSKN